MARRSGVRVSTLHFHEAQGLISGWRTDGNQRRYARDVLRRVALIRVAQAVGISLAEVATVLALLPEDAAPSRADWTRLSAAWRDQLNERIAQMTRLRCTLDDCIGCGCLSIDRCRLRNPADRLKADGTGPQRLLVRHSADGHLAKVATGSRGVAVRWAVVDHARRGATSDRWMHVRTDSAAAWSAS